MSRFSILALLLAAAPARADDREGAAAHFQAAQAAERRDDWKDAIEEYEKAYRLAPHPSVLFNIGAAYEKLDDRRHAAEYFERYLRDAPRADDRADVEKRIAALRDRPSQLTVATPSRAWLILDGKVAGRVPLSIDIPPGDHVIHIKTEMGRESREKAFTAAFGEPVKIDFVNEPASEPPVDEDIAPIRMHARGQIGGSLGTKLHTGLTGEWDEGIPLSFVGRLRGGFSLSRKLRVVFEIGGEIGPGIEDSRIGSDLGPKETFFAFEPRGGISYTLWQHSAGVQLDAIGFGTLLAGYHSLGFGSDTVARQAIFGAGAGGGFEISGVSEKSPRGRWFASAAYAVVPTAVGSDTGFRSTGTVDLGGFEVMFGWSVMLGISRPTATSSWSAQR